MPRGKRAPQKKAEKTPKVDVAEEPQMALNEVVLDDADLLALLVQREELNAKAAELRTVTKRIKERFPATEAQGKRYRIGPYVIEGKLTAARDVSFHADGGFRLSIKKDGQE